MHTHRFLKLECTGQNKVQGSSLEETLVSDTTGTLPSRPLSEVTREIAFQGVYGPNNQMVYYFTHKPHEWLAAPYVHELQLCMYVHEVVVWRLFLCVLREACH